MNAKQNGGTLSLCWQCQNTNRFKCSWFDPDNPQPVPGWTAELRPKSNIEETYLVLECPKFVPHTAPPPPSPKPPTTPGVYPTKEGCWQARIYWNRRDYYLGYFKTKEEAIAARLAAEEATKRGEEPCRNKK